MELEPVLQELQSLGTEQNIKVYRKHGVSRDFYGVSFGNLRSLTKKLKKNQPLAEDLWDSGIHDARMLATMIADPQKITLEQLQTWAAGLDNYIISDALASLASQTPHAHSLVEDWTKSSQEWVGRAGWMTLAQLAMQDQTLEDDLLIHYLAFIEKNIHTSKNRVRDAMNSALIAIGIRSHKLEEIAVACAGQIGKIDVDHGETGCKTPEAIAYIRKSWEHKEKAIK